MAKQKNKSDMITHQIDAMFPEKLLGKDAERLKANFIATSPKEILEEPADVSTGVGNGNNLNFDALENLHIWDSGDDIIVEHKRECKECTETKNCEELENILGDSIEIDYTIYTDGNFVKQPDGTTIIVDDTITVKYNNNENTYQVIKSPKIVLKPAASMCYPGQCDLDGDSDAEGYVFKCYTLPEEYLQENIDD